MDPLCRNCGWLIRRGRDGWQHTADNRLCLHPEPAVQIMVDKTDDELLREKGIQV